MARNNDESSMRILYGITKSNWGGAQHYVFDLALAANKAGHDVTVMCGGEGILIEKLTTAGIRVISLPYVRRDIKIQDEIKGLWEVFRILRREKPDVFHINSSKMGGLGALAARMARIKKIIFTAHGWAFNENRSLIQKLIIKKLAWYTVMLSHKTICVSEAIKSGLNGLPLMQNKLEVIRHGIDKFQVLPTSVPRTHIVVGTISELHKVKGLDVAIRGFARAFKYTDTTFEIIGDGDEKEALTQLVKELGIESQVKFLGFKENAREMLSQFDIFILASRSEALGYVLLEAGMASLPVIATDVGGIPEIVRNGETGILIPPEDPQSLASALKKLSADEKERTRLGNNLSKSVKKSFSKKRMVEETLNLYARIHS